jgi:hypothetical protein
MSWGSCMEALVEKLTSKHCIVADNHKYHYVYEQPFEHSF